MLKENVELSDLLILYFDTLLIIHVKSIMQGQLIIEYYNGLLTNDKKSDFEVELKRYVKKSILHGCKQIKATYNRMTDPKGDKPIILHNDRRGQLEWKPKNIKRIYTILICEEEVPIVNFNLGRSLFPEIDSYKFTPIIFNSQDLLYILDILDTPSKLVAKLV